jgi:NTF2 fold immunity protein
MNIKLVLILAAVALVVGCNRNRLASNRSVAVSDRQTQSNTLKPKDGYVPDEKTAIAIASAVWSPVFGSDRIEDQKPITANLQNGVWVVTGRNGMGFDGHSTFVALISADDGRVIEVSAFND